VLPGDIVAGLAKGPPASDHRQALRSFVNRMSRGAVGSLAGVAFMR
jgi:hypothetical protein